jgi:phospholipid/cholesterol/gamma-HCH transport system substrate-binding protein
MRLERIRQLPNPVVGLIAVVVLAIASYLAFTKNVPWGGGHTYHAVFTTAQNVRPDSPVRIAGVDVGTVTSVTALPTGSESFASGVGEEGALPAAAEDATTATLVTLELDDEALPLKEDARLKLRPRLFLEGNLFVELQPGSPSAPEVDEGYTFSVSQTAGSVQLDQIFTNSLQSDVRRDLQVFLDQFGQALIDEGGAESIRTLYRTSPGAFRSTSQVNEALLGQNAGDLSGLIRNLGRVVRGLGRNEEALKDTVTNLRIFTGSLAAEDAALEQAIVELPGVLDAAGPAFANLNASFPPLRAFAREIMPGVETAPETLEVATPLLRQLRLLSRPAELRGLVADLRPAVPDLARLTRRTIPFLEESRALSSCFNNVIIPWGDDTVDGGPAYPHPPVGPVYKETAYGLAGIAGESRSQDANGQYIRVAGSGGGNTVTVQNDYGQTFGGVTGLPLEGAMPTIESSAKTRFRPGQPCENQEPPDLRGTLGPPPDQTRVAADAEVTEGKVGRIMEHAKSIFDGYGEALQLSEEGENAEARRTERRTLRSLERYYDGEFGDRDR